METSDVGGKGDEVEGVVEGLKRGAGREGGLVGGGVEGVAFKK